MRENSHRILLTRVDTFRNQLTTSKNQHQIHNKPYIYKCLLSSWNEKKQILFTNNSYFFTVLTYGFMSTISKKKNGCKNLIYFQFKGLFFESQNYFMIFFCKMIFLNLESYRKIQNIQTSMQIPYKYRRVRDLPSLSQNFVLFNGTFPRSTTPTEKICQRIKGKFCPASVMRIDYGLIKNSQRKNTEIDTGKKEYEIFRIDKAIESLKKKKLKPVLESEDQINRETYQNLAPSSQSLIRETSKQSMFQFARKKRNYKALPFKNFHLSRHAHYSTHKKPLNAEECGRTSTSSDDNRYLSPRYKEGS